MSVRHLFRRNTECFHPAFGDYFGRAGTAPVDNSYSPDLRMNYHVRHAHRQMPLMPGNQEGIDGTACSAAVILTTLPAIPPGHFAPIPGTQADDKPPEECRMQQFFLFS